MTSLTRIAHRSVIGRHPAIIQAAPNPKPPIPDGAVLGTNRAKQEVKVKRIVGSMQGYDDRLQAIAVARVGKAEPAAVVLRNDGKWLALETTASFKLGKVDPADTAPSSQYQITEVHGLTLASGLPKAIKWIEQIQQWMAKLDEWEEQFKNNESMVLAIREQRDDAIKKLSEAQRLRAAFVLGVPETEIESVMFPSGRLPGKINLVGIPGKGSTGASHGSVGGDGGFKPNTPSAFSIDLPELDDPTRAQTALFHEVQHKRDYDLAQFWVAKYEASGAIFVSGTPGRAPFERWLNTQVKNKLLKPHEVELIIAETFNDSADTEARANVRTFLAALQAGSPDVATRLLVAYAHALKPKKEGGGGQYASPATGSLVQAALVDELRAAYNSMPDPMKRQYDAAVAAARQEYPSAWISDLAFAKRPKK